MSFSSVQSKIIGETPWRRNDIQRSGVCMYSYSMYTGMQNKGILQQRGSGWRVSAHVWVGAFHSLDQKCQLLLPLNAAPVPRLKRRNMHGYSSSVHYPIGGHIIDPRSPVYRTSSTVAACQTLPLVSVQWT